MMSVGKPVFTAEQIRRWDQATMQREPVSSLLLMERAAMAIFDWWLARYSPARPVWCFCGPGNNGGDGLALARLLQQAGYTVQVCLMADPAQLSPDSAANLARWQAIGQPCHLITQPADLPVLPESGIIVDALYGAGLNRPLQGIAAQIVEALNASGLPIISIDIASGLQPDSCVSDGQPCIHPAVTLAFEVPKPAFFFAENARCTGDWQVLPIGLDQQFGEEEPTQWRWFDELAALWLRRPRDRHSHKGTFGHVLTLGGSLSRIGAILLSTQAALRGGAGLVTACVPACGYEILQTGAPAAMCLTGGTKYLHKLPDLSPYAAVAVGPGLGTRPKTARMLEKLLIRSKEHGIPLVLDADALNLIAMHPALRAILPAGSVLTPHPKECERLFGPAANTADRLQQLQMICAGEGLIVVLKGAYTAVVGPDRSITSNSSGNPGMATGGSGDVLTGLIAALLAQGYPALEAARIGVWLHGRSGDLMCLETGMEGLTASDIVTGIGRAWASLG